MVQRNSRNMLDLVNKMLDRSSNKNFYVDDHTAPVFATPAPDATVPEAATVQDATIPEAATVPAASTAGPTAESDAVKLLIVEDNDDLRAFLVSILQGDYNVIQAPNGRIGLETATTEQPDFIITDVMMPEMDGLTMVHQIKQNPNICHIPIVVLSAKASLEDRLQGLKEGIDDYITKPFSATYLRQRIENIIAQRRMLQQAWLGATTAEGEHREYKLDTPQIVDADQEMMEKLMKYLESRISDQYLKVEEMADAVNLGRTVFYGKIKSIVGMAPVDFLKHIRIQRAEELISRSRMSISEIAYSVGFTDPKYFTKCFKKETGLTPTDYREQKNRENENS
jgi:YesN/AraC family two-component response regulator